MLEARQYSQLAQYCATCNRGVIPVLPVNTVTNIGIVLAYYWRSTDYYTLLLAVPADSTGPVLLLSTRPVLTANSQPSRVE